MAIETLKARLDEPDHQRAIVDLLDLYSRDTMGNGAPLPQAVRERLIDGLARQPGGLVLLARAGEQYAGLCICFAAFSTFQARPILNIHDLAVHPALRNLGIGRRLLAAAQREALERGCCKLTLEVRADNTPARHLYRDFGFTDAQPPMNFWHKLL